METPPRINSGINNDFYNELAEGWYTSNDHPIALLRAENALRIPWILREIGTPKTVLDIGCGAGLLTNALAQNGHTVHGIDLSETSLEVAKRHDLTQTVTYQKANAYHLPYPDQAFDIVCAMDVLEHVEEPKRLIAEASRVLKPHGLFFFHTFNRNLLSYLIVIKGVEWCVPNAPKNMHVYPLFIKPRELKKLCEEHHLQMKKLHGFRPQIFTSAFLKMVFQRKVPETFRFCFSKSLATGYCGCSIKEVPMSTAFKGKPVKLAGHLPPLHAKVPDFCLVDQNLKDHSLKEFQGKRKLLATVPSLDTGTCSLMTKHFNEASKKHPNALFITVSADLPFAQKRFCEHENVHNVYILSMMRDKEFGKAYGVLIQEGPMAGLLARAVFVLDEKDHLLYLELVPEITQEPNYHKAIDALKG